MLLKNLSKLFPLLSSRGCTAHAAYSTLADPTEEKIRVGSYEINYLKVGTGAHNVLCMPGVLGSIWTDFKHQVEGLDLGKFTLVVWDPPGYGKSRPPLRDFSKNFFERDAEYAYEFMKALNIPKYSLLGWSGGGTTSMILAAKHPEAVQKLIIWGSISFILNHELEFYEKVRDVNSWSKKMREPMVELYGEELFAKYLIEWVDSMTAIYKTKNGEICSQLLKDIKCATLILYGEEDPIVGKIHASHLHANIAGSRLKLYPKGKHNVHMSFAEDFNRTVQEFLLLP